MYSIDYIELLPLQKLYFFYQKYGAYLSFIEHILITVYCRFSVWMKPLIQRLILDKYSEFQQNTCVGTHFQINLRLEICYIETFRIYIPEQHCV